MQIKKNGGGNDEKDQFKIPKDITKLPILSMLINYKLPKTELKGKLVNLIGIECNKSVSLNEANQTFAQSKSLQGNSLIRLCTKHTNEKLRYI